MASLRKSVVLSSIANFGNLAITLALVIVVSRLLPPAVIGSYIMAFSVILLIEPIRELQLRSYIVLQPAIDRQAMAPIYFFSATLSLLAFAVGLVGAAILYRSFDAAAVGNCMALMACGFLLKAWSMPAMGILQRERRFQSLAAIRLGSALVKSAVTLALVFDGWGAEALAIGQLAEFAFELIGLGMISRDLRWVRPRLEGVREIARFCAQFGGAQLAGQISAALDGVLIGSFQGLAATALYNRGSRIVRTFRSGIEQAILPIALTEFALVREDRAKLRDAYLRAVGALTGVSWPMLVATIVLAGPIVLGLFGPQWIAAVHLTQILAVGAIIHAASALSQQVHVSAGESSLLLKREGYLSGFRIVLLLITAQISTEAVAYGFVLMLAVSFVVNQALLRQSFGITTRDFLRANWKSAVVASIVGTAAFFSLRWRPADMSNALALFVFGAICAVVWLISLGIVRHHLFKELIQMIAGRLKRRHANSASSDS